MASKSKNIFKEILKKEGLRYTQQRQLVWDEIKNRKIGKTK